MTAEVKIEQNITDLPFMCGICHQQYKTIEQFDLHLQSHSIHISEQLHTCLNTDDEINKDRFIHCKLCSNRFKTLCTFHDHLTNCGGSGSYIFHYQTFQAYPLTFAFFESRDIVQPESRNQNPSLKAYDEAKLKDLFHQERNKFRNLNHNVCDASTQTSFSKDEAQLVNMSVQTSDSEETYNLRNGAKGKGLSAITSMDKSLTRTKNPCKCKEKGRKRKEVDKDFVISKHCKIYNRRDSEEQYSFRKSTIGKGLTAQNTSADKRKGKRGRKKKGVQCQTYSRPEESPALILIKTESSDTEQQTQDGNTNTISEIPSYTLSNEIKELKDEGDYDKYQMDYDGCVKEGLVKTQNKVVVPVDEKGNDKLKLEVGVDQIESLNETSLATTTCENKNEDKKNKNKTLLEKNEKGEFKCDVCGKTFSHNHKLIDHKKCHSSVRAVKCDVCPKRFKHKRHMMYHRRLKHGIIPEKRKPKDREDCKKKPKGRTLYRRSACDVCGLVFMNCRLKYHVLIHSDVRAHSCDICSKSFKDPRQLRVHKRSHDNVLPYCCERCGKCFFDSATFKNHILWHKDSSERPWKCEECGKGFISKFKLKRHMVTHTGEMKEQCDLCGRMFNQVSNLVTHMMRVHKSEMKIQCPRCDKRFYTNMQLHNHMNRHADLLKNINSIHNSEVEDQGKLPEEENVHDNGDPELEKPDGTTESNPTTHTLTA